MVSFNWNQPELLDRIAKLEEKVAAVQRHEERTTIALAQSNVGIFDWHLGNRSIYVSPILQDMLGYQEECMPGHLNQWLEHFHPDDRERAKQEGGEALRNQDSFRAVYRVRRRDGNLRQFLFQATLFRSGTSTEAARALGTAIDVTDIGLLP